MSYSILYNKDLISDEALLLTYINDFTKSLGENKIVINTNDCAAVLQGMRQDFPHVDGLDKASAFKKIANFVTFFIALKPIINPFSEANIGSDLAKIRNHQNTIVALQIAIDSLHGAVIHPCDNGGDITLKNRISLSRHSYIDIVTALHDAAPVTHFRMATVLFEQLVYKTNPECQYDIISI